MKNHLIIIYTSMRYLYLEETPIIEIQEAKGDNKDLWVSLGNMEFQYVR